MTFTLDVEKNREKLEDYQQFLNAQKGKPGNLMLVLHKAQEVFGYIPGEIQQMISDTLRIPRAEIYGVITFYSQFTLIPRGETQVAVCMGTACYVKGAQAALDKAEEVLGIKSGETTPDGKYSVEATRCLGACVLAPFITINEEPHGRVTPADVEELLRKDK
jgi:NADH:ubiquinone oxidoreductase subunit E